jgi:hypothetical protein
MHIVIEAIEFFLLLLCVSFLILILSNVIAIRKSFESVFIQGNNQWTEEEQHSRFNRVIQLIAESAAHAMQFKENKSHAVF